MELFENFSVGKNRFSVFLLYWAVVAIEVWPLWHLNVLIPENLDNLSRTLIFGNQNSESSNLKTFAKLEVLINTDWK